MNLEALKHPAVLAAVKTDLDSCYQLLVMYDAEKDKAQSRIEDFRAIYGEEQKIKAEIKALEAAVKELEALNAVTNHGEEATVNP